MIFTGVVSLLSLVHLRQGLGAAGGADRASLVTTGASLVGIYNGTFLLGQTLIGGSGRGNPVVRGREEAPAVPGSGCFWSWMSFLTMSRGAAPQDAAKEDGAHTCAVVRAGLIWPMYSCRERRDERPLRELTSRDGANVGG